MSEASEAKRDGARLQKNSGRGKYQKGDAVLDQFVVDYKEAGRSFTLNMSVWAKICTDAMTEGADKYPILKLILGTKRRVRIAILEWDAFMELKRKADEYDRLTG